MEQEKQLTSLPENAYRELKPGEEYTPIMPASSSPREVTPYSVTMGIVMAVVFSAAAASSPSRRSTSSDSTRHSIRYSSRRSSAACWVSSC